MFCLALLSGSGGKALANMDSHPAQKAKHVLMEGSVDEAVQMLQANLASQRDDGESHLLLCRAYYSEQKIDAAVTQCEVAVKLMPSSSVAHDWMGRAYGVKASSAGPLSGLKLAHQVLASFEAAFSLDPHDADAANDLAEFYVNAPALVGGGTDKAAQLADRVASDLPQTAHRIRALIAVKRKDYATAEKEYRAAVEVKHSAAAWVDLGGFYKSQKQPASAVDALQHAIAADTSKDSALVDAASYLIDMHTQPEAATNALRQYLSGDSKSDAAPVIWVYVLLGRLHESAGNKAAARDEFNKALRLAANYGPAIKALQTL